MSGGCNNILDAATFDGKRRFTLPLRKKAPIETKVESQTVITVLPTPIFAIDEGKAPVFTPPANENKVAPMSDEIPVAAAQVEIKEVQLDDKDYSIWPFKGNRDPILCAPPVGQCALCGEDCCDLCNSRCCSSRSASRRATFDALLYSFNPPMPYLFSSQDTSN